MMRSARLRKLADVASVQGPHNANASKHHRPAGLGNQYERLNRSLLLGGLLLCLGKLLDVGGGVLEGDEIPIAGHRHGILKPGRPGHLYEADGPGSVLAGNRTGAAHHEGPLAGKLIETRRPSRQKTDLQQVIGKKWPLTCWFLSAFGPPVHPGGLLACRFFPNLFPCVSWNADAPVGRCSSLRVAMAFRTGPASRRAFSLARLEAAPAMGGGD